MTYRSELLQVAAVAVAAIQDLDYGSTSNHDKDSLEILDEVDKERTQQETKWGPQHHSKEKWLAILVEEVGETAKDILEN